jgi:hypothetical protein
MGAGTTSFHFKRLYRLHSRSGRSRQELKENKSRGPTDLNCHVQIIAHPAKMEGHRKGQAPLLEDIAGAKHWDNMPVMEPERRINCRRFETCQLRLTN